MKNKILLGAGVATILAGVAGLFIADNAKKNNKLITIVSGIIATIGLTFTAIMVDNELYPDEFEEEEETVKSGVEEV